MLFTRDTGCTHEHTEQEDFMSNVTDIIDINSCITNPLCFKTLILIKQTKTNRRGVFTGGKRLNLNMKKVVY